MADTTKILGQSAPTATVLTDIYTAAASAAVSSIVVCNRSSTATTFRVSIAVAGVADATKQYLYYDVPIGGNDTFVATIGIPLAITDVVRGYAGTSNLTFTILGIEIT